MGINTVVHRVFIKKSIKELNEYKEKLAKGDISIKVNPFNSGIEVQLNKVLDAGINLAILGLKSKLKSMERNR